MTADAQRASSAAVSLRLGSLLLATGPLLMLVVFGLLRDVPPLGCHVEHDPTYDDGLGWVFGAAELLALGVLVAALRVADGDLWRVRMSVALVAFAAGVVSGILAEEAGWAAWWAVGLAATAATWVALTLVSGARPRVGVSVAMIAALVPCAVLLLGLLFFAAFVPWAAVLAVAAAMVFVVAWLRTDVARPADLAIAATFFALVAVPTCAVVVAAIADNGAPFCGFN